MTDNARALTDREADRRKDALYMASQMNPSGDVHHLLTTADKIYGWLCGVPTPAPTDDSGTTARKTLPGE
jgi:hypothetical protein